MAKTVTNVLPTKFNVKAQLAWNVLPNSPVATSRTDDIWFFDAITGWLVNSSGYVCKTEDGGANWTPKFFLPPNLPSKPYLRCMGWANRQIGWFGSVTGVGGETLSDLKYPSQYIRTLLHHTVDGGETWQAVENLPENSPGGICGFYAVNEQVAYGSGTNDPGLPGPAIVKTTNNGASWELIDMSEYADNLIDIYFMDENNGFVVGGKNDSSCPTDNKAYPKPRLSRYVLLKPVVLRTTDGGKTWKNKAATTSNLACGEWGWKIQFLNDKVGFVALENFRDAAILRTDDGGETWVRKHVAKSQDPNEPAINNDLEGIGFLNEREGWVGGWGNNFQGRMNSFTADGGETWSREDNVPTDPNSDQRIRINRYRISGDPANGGFAYCSGLQVYKYGDLGSKKKGAFAKKSAFAARMEPACGGEVDGTTGEAPAKKEAFAETSNKEAAFAVVAPHKTSFDQETSIKQPDNIFDLSYRQLDGGKVEIGYTLPANSSNVFLGLWNQFAFYIRTLVEEPMSPGGRKTVIWDGKDQNGQPAGKGLFICRMSTDGNKGASQMIELNC